MDGDLNFVVLAIPLFLLAVALENGIAAWKRPRAVHWVDSLTSLSCGALSTLSALILELPLIGAYLWIQSWSAGELFPFPAGGWAQAGYLITLFVTVDLVYYGFHLASHRVNLGWASHIVHHQSEFFNLTTALRQTALDVWFRWPFEIPFALLGVPLPIFLAVKSFNRVAQFWYHTELIDRCPRWMELLMMTPSHHRVHHACNPGYLDKNFGGVFLWDRLFGTLAEEKEPPRYGTTTPLIEGNPLKAQVSRYRELIAWSRSAPSWGAALALWARPPEWHPPWASPVDPPESTWHQRFAQVRPGPAIVAFAGALAVGVWLNLDGPRAGAPMWGAVVVAVALFAAYGWWVDRPAIPRPGSASRAIETGGRTSPSR